MTAPKVLTRVPQVQGISFSQSADQPVPFPPHLVAEAKDPSGEQLPFFSPTSPC